MIELTRASFQYENSDRGVQDISLSVHIDLQIEKGKIYGFIGQNGAGKTTFLRLVISFWQTLGHFLWKQHGSLL